MSKVQTSLRLEEKTFNEAKKILSSLGMNKQRDMISIILVPHNCPVL